MQQPKVLIFDIETAPMVAWVWGRRDQNIPVNHIKTDWFVLAWAAKWFGDSPKKIIYRDQRRAKNIEDDRALLQPMWELLDKADIVITQNGRRFDSRKLNARFILQGLFPPKPYKHLDTLQIARTVADFTSNSLEYLTGKLCTKYKKLSHRKFPGMELWKACLAGDQKAWVEMRKYNIHDVLSTEELYTKIKAWAPESMPKVFKPLIPNLTCRTCGLLGKMTKRGHLILRRATYQRYQCQNCGAWDTGEKILKGE